MAKRIFKLTFKDITTRIYRVIAENEEEAEMLVLEDPGHFLRDTFTEFERKVEKEVGQPSATTSQVP